MWKPCFLKQNFRLSTWLNKILIKRTSPDGVFAILTSKLISFMLIPEWRDNVASPKYKKWVVDFFCGTLNSYERKRERERMKQILTRSCFCP